MLLNFPEPCFPHFQNEARILPSNSVGLRDKMSQAVSPLTRHSSAGCNQKTTFFLLLQLATFKYTLVVLSECPRFNDISVFWLMALWSLLDVKTPSLSGANMHHLVLISTFFFPAPQGSALARALQCAGFHILLVLRLWDKGKGRTLLKQRQSLT